MAWVNRQKTLCALGFGFGSIYQGPMLRMFDSRMTCSSPGVGLMASQCHKQTRPKDVKESGVRMDDRPSQGISQIWRNSLRCPTFPCLPVETGEKLGKPKKKQARACHKKGQKGAKGNHQPQDSSWALKDFGSRKRLGHPSFPSRFFLVLISYSFNILQGWIHKNRIQAVS